MEREHPDPEDVVIGEVYGMDSPMDGPIKVEVIGGDHERDEFDLKDTETGRVWRGCADDLYAV
jgi:hypothetical protein